MVVGVYQSQESAKSAIDELVKHGYMPDQIHVRSKTASDGSSSGAAGSTFGLFSNIKGNLDSFFHGMTDGDSREEILREYAKVLEAGDTIISVDANNDAAANKAASLLSKSATVASDHTATSPAESDESSTGSWSGVRIFKDTKDSYKGL